MTRIRLRQLTVGEAVYFWTFRHRHDEVGDRTGCRSEVSVWRSGSMSRLRIVFPAADDRVVSDGFYESGAVIRLSDRAYLNLHQPGTARLLLDQVLLRELFSVAGEREVDGWMLFDAILPEDDDQSHLS